MRLHPSPLSPSVAVPAVLAILLLLAAPSASACMCVPPGSPEQELEKVDAVFTGRVADLSRVEVERGRHSLHRVRVDLELLASWKGLEEGERQAGEVVLETGLGGGDCGYGFEAGEEYLVYAWRHADGALSTDICTRTRRLEAARQDLEALGEPEARHGEP